MGLFDFFSKRTKTNDPSSMSDRYEGRPLLILLENYVLSAIGSLTPDKEQLASSVTQRIFGGGSDWRATLRAKLLLGDSLDASLREMWSTNQQRAQQVGASLSPEEFARMIIDENFVHLISPASK